MNEWTKVAGTVVDVDLAQEDIFDVVHEESVEVAVVTEEMVQHERLAAS